LATLGSSPLISGHMKVRHVHRFAPVSLLAALDRLVIRIPWLRRRITHQLMVIGSAPLR
jgi:hypothetical protein